MIYRVDESAIAEAHYKVKQSDGTKIEIPDLCVVYFTDHADQHSTILGDPRFIHFGHHFLVDGNGTGLYARDWELERIGHDGNVSIWHQKVTVSSIQPKDGNRPANPIARGHELIEMDRTFRRVASLVDWNNRPVRNKAGEYLSGFEIEIPVEILRYKGNFATLQHWARFSGCVNTQAMEIPIQFRRNDGSWQIVDYYKVPAGQAKLIVTANPVKPSIENEVLYFPYSWEWHVSPIGWAEPKLNQGFTYKVYLDRFFQPASLEQIQEGSYHTVETRTFTTDDNVTARNPHFLDWYGRKLPIEKLSGETVLQVSTAAGKGEIKPFNLEGDPEDWIGRFVVISDPDSPWRWETTIEQWFENTQEFVCSSRAPFTKTPASLSYNGINAIDFYPIQYRNLAAVPT